MVGQSFYYKETSQLVFSANQCTGFFMIGTLGLNGSIVTIAMYRICFEQISF